MGRELYILVAGSRKYNDFEEMYRVLNSLIDIYRKVGDFSKFIIVSGGASGADTLAEYYADNQGYAKIIFPADWAKYGKSAGFIRNEQMHKYLETKSHKIVVCFWDSNEQSKGTTHNFDLCKKYNNPLFIWDYYTKQFIQK